MYIFYDRNDTISKLSKQSISNISYNYYISNNNCYNNNIYRIRYNNFKRSNIMMRDISLEIEIFNYILNHESDNIDMLDLIVLFPKVDHNLLMDALIHLRTDKKIYRVNIGIHYKYTTIKPE